MSDDLKSEVVEPEVSKLKAWEPEEMELEVSEITEVYLCKGGFELSQGTLRALFSVDPQRLSLFWNPSGEKNTWENEKPLSKDLCRAEKVDASLTNTWDEQSKLGGICS